MTISSNSALIRNILLTISLCGVIATTSAVSAKSTCKGLENTACTSNTSCGWVNGYERKDGRSVKSFCRTKSSSTKNAAGLSAKKSVKKIQE